MSDEGVLVASCNVKRSRDASLFDEEWDVLDGTSCSTIEDKDSILAHACAK